MDRDKLDQLFDLTGRVAIVTGGTRGIRVNALAPGSTDTDMMRNTGPEATRMMAMASHMRRLADPEELIGPALLLASDAGSFMTGQVLIADGGLAPH